jgi:uncharacterized protein YabE (DUF348 family)
VIASRAGTLALVLPLTFSLSTPADAAQGSQQKSLTSASVSVSSTHSILPMQIRLPAQVRVIVDGRSRTLKTTAFTVADVIKESHISLGPLDLINTPLPTGVFPGLQIRVTRIKVVSSTKQVKIPYVVKKVFDKKMLVGRRIVKSQGVSGIALVHAVRTLADGKVVKTKIVSNVMIKPAHSALIIVGTRPRTVDELNWAAVANCESRGNPRSSNSANGYYGMFQFTVTAWKTAGGEGNPMDYPAAEQLMRAKRLYAIRGWRAWPTCGKLL